MEKRPEVKIGKPRAVRFNIMVVGESGQGKTTLLKTLLSTYTKVEIKKRHYNKTVKTVKIEEIGKFTLPSTTIDCEVHLYDSPGYGDYINNQNAIDTVSSYLRRAHDEWMSMDGNKLRDQERNARDERMHCVFYFIAPHRMKHIDEEFIKRLSGLAPIVPIIAKADTMTLLERREHLVDVRKRIAGLIQRTHHEVIYNFNEGGDGFLSEDSDHIDDFYDKLFREYGSQSSANAAPNDDISHAKGEPPAHDVQQTINLESSNRSITVSSTATASPYPTMVMNESVVSLSDAVDEGAHLQSSEWENVDTQNPVKAIETEDSINTTHKQFNLFEGKMEESIYEKRGENLELMVPNIEPEKVSNEQRASLTDAETSAEHDSQASPCEITHSHMFDDDFLQANISPALPKVRNIFAVVGDNTQSGKRVYPWGSLDIYDEEHSDFRRLQRLLFENNAIFDMRELTQEMSIKLVENSVPLPLPELENIQNFAVATKDFVDQTILFTAWIGIPLIGLLFLAAGFDGNLFMNYCNIISDNVKQWFMA